MLNNNNNNSYIKIKKISFIPSTYYKIFFQLTIFSLNIYSLDPYSTWTSNKTTNNFNQTFKFSINSTVITVMKFVLNY